MILKASERGGATQLGLHLLRTDENEHVEIHDINGFVSDDIVGALNEIYAVSRGTRCKNFMFSVSLNPPETENVPIEVFEAAIARIEEKNGLSGQPKIVVFHEKEGRRHAHCVWSRIDTVEMKAINLPFFKDKLTDISKQLYIENGWPLPEGLKNPALRDPLTFSLEEWQQCKRAGIDPKERKAVFRECWKASDGKKAFAGALSDYGLVLAKGDRRGFVAVDYQGEVYAVARYAGIRTKEVREKLGEPHDLPSVDEAKARIAKNMGHKLKSFIREKEEALKSALAPLDGKRQKLAAYHRDERKRLEDTRKQRQESETIKRLNRFRKGFLGLWDALNGKVAKIKSQNALEAFWSHQRDTRERQDLIEGQLAERRTLQRQIRQMRRRHTKAVMDLERDIARYLDMDIDAQDQTLTPKPDKRLRRRQTLTPKPQL